MCLYEVKVTEKETCVWVCARVRERERERARSGKINCVCASSTESERRPELLVFVSETECEATKAHSMLLFKVPFFIPTFFETQKSLK